MLLLILLQGSMRGQKTMTDPHLSASQLHAPHDLVAAATFQDDALWGVRARLGLLSNMLGEIQGKEELPAPVLRASQLRCKHQ